MCWKAVWSCKKWSFISVWFKAYSFKKLMELAICEYNTLNSWSLISTEIPNCANSLVASNLSSKFSFCSLYHPIKKSSSISKLKFSIWLINAANLFSIWFLHSSPICMMFEIAWSYSSKVFKESTLEWTSSLKLSLKAICSSLNNVLNFDEIVSKRFL